MTQTSDKWAKVRLQFDALPYPNLPLEQTPGDHPTYLSAHSCVIPYYLRDHQVIDPQDKWILDAGCGSGYKAMALALANPGAYIVGVDISANSIELAKQRVEYHGLANSIEFHCLPLEELPALGQAFDYINCDETLYLLPDPAAGLKALQVVLKPTGILRANLHSRLQREDCYRAQALFKQFGCLQAAVNQAEIALVRQTMASLQDWVMTKRLLWNQNPEVQTNDEMIAANFLLRNDQGFTMEEFSALLRQANLELINMVNWREWNLEKLFKNVEDLPIAIALGLADMSFEEQLYMFELLHPTHRLLDLYCGHPGQGRDRPPLEDWTMTQWQRAKVYLHPQLCTQKFADILTAGTRRLGTLALHEHFPIGNQKLNLDDSIAGCLYPLIKQPLMMSELCDRWQQIHPVEPTTLAPVDPSQVFLTMQNILIQLETAGYILIEVI
ncbi:MAG: class I SAM-dependent methyltransferase [Leptolyngbya sp. SIOISBB]|nr:class I SAM-dependent methyltransferase [Leptolyngbya sp. SIOISBB]